MESPVKPPYEVTRVEEPDETFLEAVNEEVLSKARERMMARVRLLWDNRQFLIRATICGLLVAIAIALLIPKRYQATAELMPPSQNDGTGAAMLAALSGRSGGGLASLAESALGLKTTGALFVGILKSNSVKDDVIKKFNLQEVYKTGYIEDTRRELAAHTDISEDQKSGIISIAVTDHSPQQAAAMAQEYVSQLNWVVTHLSTSAAHRERVFLDQRLKQVKEDLEEAEKQFSHFASQNGAIDIPNQGKAMVTAAATLQGELIAAEAELRGFRQIYTDNNVRVRSLEARVSELRGSLEKLVGKGSNEKTTADRIYPSLRELPVLGVTYADLLRRTKVEEAIFETLTRENELAKVQEAKEIPSVKVLDPPKLPQKKSFPPRTAIVILGTMFAFIFSAGWVLASSAWKASDPGDPRKALALDVWEDLRASLRWNGKNGSRLKAPAGWLKGKFRRSDNGGTGAPKPEEATENQR